MIKAFTKLKAWFFSLSWEKEEEGLALFGRYLSEDRERLALIVDKDGEYHFEVWTPWGPSPWSSLGKWKTKTQRGAKKWACEKLLEEGKRVDRLISRNLM